MTPITGPVEDFLYQEIPPEVWHYTSLSGFEGIVSTSKIWATEARSTNDTTEFIHARDVALEYLKKVQGRDEHLKFSLHHAYQIVAGAFDHGALSKNMNEVFLASFSAAEDLKSQWADYADQHHGVSIAFDLRNIRPPKGLGFGVTFAPCVYDQAEKESLIGSALGHFLDTSVRAHRQVSSQRFVQQRMRDEEIIQRALGNRKLCRSSFDPMIQQDMREMKNEVLDSATRISFDFLRLASHCKNSKFFQEQEWRLGLPIPKGNLKDRVRFRDASWPYIESNLFQSNDRLPITRVMLGPLCSSRKEVEGILKSQGYDVPVIDSDIPLR